MAVAAVAGLIAICVTLAANWDKVEAAAARLGANVLKQFQI